MVIGRVCTCSLLYCKRPFVQNILPWILIYQLLFKTQPLYLKGGFNLSQESTCLRSTVSALGVGVYFAKDCLEYKLLYHDLSK